MNHEEGGGRGEAEGVESPDDLRPQFIPDPMCYRPSPKDKYLELLGKLKPALNTAVRQTADIGHGKEKVVYPHPTDEHKAIAIMQSETPAQELIERYYLNKILHLLFPENIPDIHMVGTEPPSLIVERIHSTIGTNRYKTGEEAAEEEAERDAITASLEYAGVSMDEYEENFVRSKDTNSLYYVDNVNRRRFHQYRNDLRGAIEDMLSGTKKEDALRYLARLDDVEKEDAEYRKPKTRKEG